VHCPEKKTSLWLVDNQKFKNHTFGFLIVALKPTRSRNSLFVEMMDCSNAYPSGGGECSVEITPTTIRVEMQTPDPHLIPRTINCLLSCGIAPDCGADDILEQYYGPGGIVDHDNAEHMDSVLAASARNSGLSDFYRPELTAAVL